MLVVVIAGWMLGISPVLTQVSAASTQTASIQATNQSSQTQLATLRVQFANIGKLKSKLTSVRLSIPEAQAASIFINEITALGVANGVTLQTATIASATLYAAAPPSTAATGSTAAATATPTAAPVVPTPGAAAATTASGLVIVPVTVSVKGSLAQVQAFVAALQTGQRLFISSGLVLSTDAGTGLVLANVTGDIFTLRGTSDLSPKTKLTPTPIATVTPTATPTPTATATTSSSKSKSKPAPVVVPSPTPTPPGTPARP